MTKKINNKKINWLITLIFYIRSIFLIINLYNSQWRIKTIRSTQEKETIFKYLKMHLKIGKFKVTEDGGGILLKIKKLL